MDQVISYSDYFEFKVIGGNAIFFAKQKTKEKFIGELAANGSVPDVTMAPLCSDLFYNQLLFQFSDS